MKQRIPHKIPDQRGICGGFSLVPPRGFEPPTNGLGNHWPSEALCLIRGTFRALRGCGVQQTCNSDPATTARNPVESDMPRRGNRPRHAVQWYWTSAHDRLTCAA